MRFLSGAPEYELTYSDVFLVPNHSSIDSRMSVSLQADDEVGLKIPVVAANMTSVTGKRLAAAMARRGGLAVLPQDTPLQQLDDAIRWVKRQPVAFDTPITFGPDDTVSDALGRVMPWAGYGVCLLDSAAEFLGCVSGPQLAHALPDARLGDLLIGGVTALDAQEVLDARAAFDLMVAADLHFAPVLDRGKLVGTLSRSSALRSTIYEPAVDAAGRLKVSAALGVRGDVTERALALAEAGVDVLVLDTAHGDQDPMFEAVRAVRAAGIELPLVAGNVVTAVAARELAKAGADVIKVGVGPGAMCTTRMMTAVGRPQFSAVLETVQAAADHGARVWADGGVKHPRDVALALAAGASAVMVGSWFAGTLEAPGLIEYDEDNRPYSRSWGMASSRAVAERYSKDDAYELARKMLFSEGIADSRVYLDEQRPSVEDLLDKITTGVRSAMTYTGAASLTDFARQAVVGVQSAAGYEEGKPQPVRG